MRWHAGKLKQADGSPVADNSATGLPLRITAVMVRGNAFCPNLVYP
jgi:hypothetical protein